MTSPSIELRTRQSLTLTPRLQQSVRLLQLSALELAQEIDNALATNPFLEYEELADGAPQSQTASDSTDTVGSSEASTADEAPAAASSAADDAPASSTDDTSADYQSESDSYSDGYTPSRNHSGSDSDGMDVGDWMVAQADMRTRLHEALRTYSLGERDRLAAQVIIESLDDDGYLRQPFSELTELPEFDPQLGEQLDGATDHHSDALVQPGDEPDDQPIAPFSEDELRVALMLVQTLAKPGIGARTLSECLTLQLEAMDADTPGREIALELCAHHLERLARREQAELQKQLKCDAEALKIACGLIRRLDPKPGEDYRPQENNYVIPDVIVRQVKNRWVVTINPAVMPKARIHRVYADLLSQSDGGSRSPIAQQLQEARWLMRNVQQRFTTIQRVAESIVAHQRAFFDYGEIALKPLVLRDIADELNLHESTVSRATGNKYMATPRGIFEFKHFFPRELGTESGGTCSAAAVRALLKEMISAESADAPLSDVTLAQLLAQQGVIVARRTVAKYRRLMKVPPAELRRGADRQA